MITTETIENGARDILNASLGMFRTAEDTIGSVRKQIETGYADLVSNGAKDTSEVAVQLRRYLDEGVTVLKDAQTKVEGVFVK